MGEVQSDVARAARAVVRALLAGGRLVYVGAGTSGRIAAGDAAECPPTFGTRPDRVLALIAGGRTALAAAVEGAEDDARAGAAAVRRAKVTRKDLVCGVSASAKTPFVLGALAEAKRLGARTVLVSASSGGRKGLADLRVVAKTGPELVAGSTRLKAGTATKLILNAMSTAAMIAQGRIYRGRMIDLARGSQKLRARAEAIVTDLTGLPRAAAKRLLRRAQGRPRDALAMHLTGLPLREARRAARGRSLRELESSE